MSELCWKCREFMEAVRFQNTSYIHCHHEPKEKPKCWCEYPNYIKEYSYQAKDIKFRGIQILKTNDHLVHSICALNFCPQCGKKLGD